MALIDELRDATGEPAASFQLLGEDLAALPAAAIVRAGDAYRAALSELPSDLRDDFEREQQIALGEAHRWLRRHNANVHARIAGYLALGRRLEFAYQWPVVAMLGICQVLSGYARSHIYGLAGAAMRRLRYPMLARMTEATDDILRRTNRSIFADSVPTVLYALHCCALAKRGKDELAGALLDGPLPPIFDEVSRSLMRGLFDALQLEDDDIRFRALADLTSEHFSREQQIFTHHMGASVATKPRRAHGWNRRLTELRSVAAPVVSRDKRGARSLVFRDFILPNGFDIRDHEARYRSFSAHSCRP